MKNSFVLGLVGVISSFCFINEATAYFCDGSSCRHVNGLSSCLYEKQYDNYNEMVANGDRHCAASAQELCI